jgi:hypothetical protein
MLLNDIPYNTSLSIDQIQEENSILNYHWDYIIEWHIYW